MPGMLCRSRSATTSGVIKPKVFGKKWQPAKRIVQFEKKFVAGAIDPAAFDRSRLICGNLPELGEPAEVIEAYEIASLCGPAQALNPPAVSVTAHRHPSCKADCPSAGQWR